MNKANLKLGAPAHHNSEGSELDIYVQVEKEDGEDYTMHHFEIYLDSSKTIVFTLTESDMLEIMAWGKDELKRQKSP